MYRAMHAAALHALVCLFLAAGVAVSPAASAAETTGDGTRPNSLYPGSWSIQFQTTEYLGLKPFNGKLVSLKRHLSNRAALRLGISFDVDGNDARDPELREVADTTYSWYDSNTDSDYQKFSIDLSYLRYVSPGSYVNFFWGIGPVVGFSRSERTVDWTDTDPLSRSRIRSDRDYTRTWEIGSLGLVGVEWFLSKHISFHSEYRASVVYRRTVVEKERIDNYTQKQRYFNTDEGDVVDFQSVYVILGLSVYF
jgi:opacity protein-like surface antigen